MSGAGWGEGLAAGGLALYLWGAIGVALLALAVEVILLALRRRNIRGFLAGDRSLPKR